MAGLRRSASGRFHLPARARAARARRQQILWDEAARFRGSRHANIIAVSESTFLRSKRKNLFDLPQMVTLKGVGEAAVYRVKRADPPRLALAG